MARKSRSKKEETVSEKSDEFDDVDGYGPIY